VFKEYPDHDATGLASLIASGQVSAAEVLEAALAKVDAGEPRLNAIAEDLRARARTQPIAAGPFAGVPFLLKDLGQAYAGASMSHGTVALKNRPADHNAEVTNRFLAAGLVITGTTTTPELGLRATTETAAHGATRNPWDTTRTPGGSSGGAAVAIAAGYVPIAGASDGGGSIRIPSSYCGLFGLKPSRGRVPAGPDSAEGWDGASVNHVITRTVRDSAAMLDAIAGPDSGAPFHIAPPPRPYAQEIGAPVERLRIGFSTASPVGGRVEPAQINAVHNAAKLLESLGHNVEEAAPAIDGKAVAACFFTMYYGHVAAEVAAICARTGAPESSFHADTRAGALLGRAISARTYVESRGRWNEFARAMGKFHATYDIYLTPVTAMGPARIGELETPKSQQTISKILIALRAGKLLLNSGLVEDLTFKNLERTPFTILANLTFCPAMSVPLHWDENNMPVGVQFAARYGNESLLLRLASQLESAQPWAQRRPAGF
jgi:amidase